MLRKKEKGFTLIELMIVVAIIGILAAIAVPSFMSYRQRSYDKQANSIAKNIASAQSAYNAKREFYTDDDAVIVLIDTNIPASDTSDGVEWAIESADAVSFAATATHSLGSGVVFSVDQTGDIDIN